jgi:hypothetical protein
MYDRLKCPRKSLDQKRSPYFRDGKTVQPVFLSGLIACPLFRVSSTVAVASETLVVIGSQENQFVFISFPFSGQSSRGEPERLRRTGPL